MRYINAGIAAYNLFLPFTGADSSAPTSLSKQSFTPQS